MNKVEQIMYIILSGVSIFFIFPIMELLIDQEITRDFILLGALIGGGIIFTGVITILFPPVSQSIKSENNQARAEKDGHTLKDSVLPGAEFVQSTHSEVSK